MNIKKWISRQTGWIKDYLREISIIIISLCITYYGDSIMDAYADKAEDEETMKMLYDELSANITEYGEMKDYYERDILLSETYKRYRQNGCNFASDTIKSLKGQHRLFRFWTLKVNAFKIASQSPTMKRTDKALLMKIYESYEYLQVAEDMGTTYRDKRFNAIMELVNANANAGEAKDLMQQWQQIGNSEVFEHYVTTVMPALAKSTLSICIFSMQSAINAQEAILAEYPSVKDK